jgi:hypothetical protein
VVGNQVQTCTCHLCSCAFLVQYDRSDYQSPTIGELRAMVIGEKTSPGKLDILVYCPLTGRCQSALILANSVGNRKLCYATPWPKTIVGTDMRCTSCKKHFRSYFGEIIFDIIIMWMKLNSLDKECYVLNHVLT